MKAILLVLIFWLLCALLALSGCEDNDTETFDVNNTFDTNDIIWQGSIDKAVFIQFGFSDTNSVDEAASALRRMDTRNAKEVIDIEVTIGNETHAASFEDFFEWMGFER